MLLFNNLVFIYSLILEGSKEFRVPFTTREINRKKLEEKNKVKIQLYILHNSAVTLLKITV